jgi:hypothetical protein
MSTHKKRKISARYLTQKETSYSFSFLEAIFNVERKFPAKKQNTKKIRKADRVTPISSSRRVDHNEVSPPSFPSLAFSFSWLQDCFSIQSLPESFFSCDWNGTPCTAEKQHT